MKLCVVGPVYPYRGGIAHHTALLSMSLEKNVHDVLVVSFSRQYPAFLYPGKTDRDSSQNPIKVDAEFILDPLYPWTWLACYKRIRDFSPDLVVFQWWTTFWAVAYFALAFLLNKSGFKSCFLVHNTLPHEKHLGDRFLARLALGQAHRVIVQAESEKQKLNDLLPGKKALLVSLPIYDMFANNNLSKAGAKDKLGIQPESMVLLFFGIVRPYKGLNFLIEALPQLLKKYKDILLVVAGEFWEKQSVYDDLCEVLGVQDSVRIVNSYIPNEDVPLYFTAADIFVAPYVTSTQSAVVKIALAYNLPIVASNCVIDETLKNAEYVYPVVESSSADLARTISSVIDQRPFSISRKLPGWSEMVNTVEQIAQV